MLSSGKVWFICISSSVLVIVIVLYFCSSSYILEPVADKLHSDAATSPATGNYETPIEEHMEDFSLAQQLGNKTIVNKYHLPLVHDVAWCGNVSVWNEYVNFHYDVLHGHRAGKGYLRYFCRPSRCGGYGNRIQAITIALIMAMLTQRVFLLEMTYPLNLLEYISPNAVQWDSSIVPHSIVTHDLYSPSRIKKYWPAFVNDLLTDGGAEMIEFRSNEGFTYFYPEMVKSPHILQLFMSLGADNRSNYAGLYGCTVKFLFNLRPVTTWAAVSQLRNLGLVAGKYVAVHIRTSLSSLEGDLRHADPTEWNKFLQCAVRTSNYLAKKLRLKSVPIFLAADEDVVKEYAVNNFGNRVVLSQVYTLHVDRPRVKAAWLLREGFLGVLTDMEVMSRAAVLIKSISTFSDVIEGLGFFRSNESYIYTHCQY